MMTVVLIAAPAVGQWKKEPDYCPGGQKRQRRRWTAEAAMSRRRQSDRQPGHRPCTAAGPGSGPGSASVAPVPSACGGPEGHRKGYNKIAGCSVS